MLQIFVVVTLNYAAVSHGHMVVVHPFHKETRDYSRVICLEDDVKRYLYFVQVLSHILQHVKDIYST